MKCREILQNIESYLKNAIRTAKTIWIFLNHGGLVAPYDDTDLGKHGLRWWIGTGRYQAITWTNVDLSSMGLCGVHLKAVSQEVLKNSIQNSD